MTICALLVLTYGRSQLHVVVSLGVFALGALYWFVWTILLPKYGNYRLERQWVVQSDGVSRGVFVKVPGAKTPPET